MDADPDEFRDEFKSTIGAAISSIEQAQAGLRDNLPAGTVTDQSAGKVADYLRDARRSLQHAATAL